MDFALVIFWLFAGVSILYVVHFGLYLVGANFYDVWQQRRKGMRSVRQARQHEAECAATATWTRRALPEVPGLVSIVIAAHNEESVIVRTLDSIRRSTYRSFEVLVADDASTDLTGRLVRDYQVRHPEMDLHLVRMRKNVGKGAALNAVLRRHARGQFVMTLDADSIIEPDAITNALSYFDDPYVAGVAANVQILEETTVLGILQRFEHMIGYRSKKLYSLLNCRVRGGWRGLHLPDARAAEGRFLRHGHRDRGHRPEREDHQPGQPALPDDLRRRRGGARPRACSRSAPWRSSATAGSTEASRTSSSTAA